MDLAELEEREIEHSSEEESESQKYIRNINPKSFSVESTTL